MNKIILIIPSLLSFGAGLMANFFIVRAIIRKLNKPRNKQQQSRVAVVLTILLTVPSLVRLKELVSLDEAQSAEWQITA